jgi:hypothetical protein
MRVADIRRKMEGHIRNTLLKSVQGPVGVKPALKAWMELTKDGSSAKARG